MNDDVKKAFSALEFIIPFLTKYNFRWVITGGFACYVYGVPRNITDIDIDIDTTKDSTAFQNFLFNLKQYITQPLEHFVDQNYDNYNFEVTIGGQVIDICPMVEMRVYDNKTEKYEQFYGKEFPDVEAVSWKGLELSLLSKSLIIKNKEMLVWKRESDIRDIEGLKKLS